MSDMKHINVKLPVELHKELKVLAANQSQTLEAVITHAVQNIIIKKEVTK